MNLYDTNLTYTLSDMLIHTFDFSPIEKAIDDVLEENPKKIGISIRAITPTPKSYLLEKFYAEGKLKSYQMKEICVKIYELIKNALRANFQDALNRFIKIRNAVEIKVKNNIEEFNISIRILNTILVAPNIIKAIVRQFNVIDLGYCDELIVTILVSQQDNSEKIVFKSTISPIPLTEFREFLQLANKEEVMEFYRCPIVKDILFNYFFPLDQCSDRRTEITYDSLREETIAQKRRKVLLRSGEYMNLHDAISPYMTHEEFLDIIDINNILGFYPSVRTAMTHEMVTAVIDIDVLGFLRSAFSSEVLWKFILKITEQLIINLAHKFNFPPPLVVFSGSKGVHLLYRLSEDCVNTDFDYVNFPELYLLPSQKELSKNNASIVHDKFIFIKTMLQAILLYTVENFKINKIPEVMRNQLGIIGMMDMFTLSVFSHNKIGILLDTTSNNSSVHRVFSFHPTTGYVAIPILDPYTKKIREECKEYSSLLEECRPETILKNIESGNKHFYLQFPPQIYNKNIRYLLRPDVLLPTLSVLLRFSDRWITERSVNSYSFWIGFYELNNLYQYLLLKLRSIDKKDVNISEIYKETVEIIENSNVKTRKQVKEIINMFFFDDISYKVLSVKLNAFRDLEFFFRFKKDQIIKVTPEQLDYYYENFRERRYFFRKFKSFLNITLILLGHYFKNSTQMKSYGRKAVEQLYNQLAFFIDDMKLLKSKEISIKEDDIQLRFTQIAVIFNILVCFLQKVFQFSDTRGEWRFLCQI